MFESVGVVHFETIVQLFSLSKAVLRESNVQIQKRSELPFQSLFFLKLHMQVAWETYQHTPFLPSGLPAPKFFVLGVHDLSLSGLWTLRYSQLDISSYRKATSRLG